MLVFEPSDDARVSLPNAPFSPPGVPLGATHLPLDWSDTHTTIEGELLAVAEFL